MINRSQMQTSLLAAVFAALTFAGIAAAQAPVRDRDAVEERVEGVWKADSVMKACQGCDIDVEFKDGVATLTGEVPEARYKRLAATLAKVEGVGRVDNQITIDARTPADKVRDGLNKAADKTVGAVAGAGEVASDAWITSKVKAKLATSDAVEGSHIEVTTKDNRVTLSGTVPSAAARTAAVALARGIDGVRAVEDKLTVQ